LWERSSTSVKSIGTYIRIMYLIRIMRIMYIRILQDITVMGALLELGKVTVLVEG